MTDTATDTWLDEILADEEVGQIITKAHSILQEGGWTKGTVYDSETGNYCAWGALQEAAGIPVRTGKWDGYDPTIKAAEQKARKAAKVIVAIAQPYRVDEMIKGWQNSSTMVVTWNDGLPSATGWPKVDQAFTEAEERIVSDPVTVAMRQKITEAQEAVQRHNAAIALADQAKADAVKARDKAQTMVNDLKNALVLLRQDLSES